MNFEIHDSEQCKEYANITEAQRAGHVCMLVCQPGSKPNMTALKRYGVNVKDLLVALTESGMESGNVSNIGHQSGAVEVFTI